MPTDKASPSFGKAKPYDYLVTNQLALLLTHQLLTGKRFCERWFAPTLCRCQVSPWAAEASAMPAMHSVLNSAKECLDRHQSFLAQLYNM